MEGKSKEDALKVALRLFEEVQTELLLEDIELNEDESNDMFRAILKKLYENTHHNEYEIGEVK